MLYQNLKPAFDWDEKTGITKCSILDTAKQRKYNGIAKTHPLDMQFRNKYTGYDIAYMRALLDYLNKSYQEIQNNIKLFKEIIETIKQQHNDQDIIKVINQHINDNEHKIKDIKIQSITISEDLKNYIEDKEKFYQKIRTKRDKGQI